MSSSSPVPVPRTAVPIGIADPVEQARAELKAALFALEEKANLPKRVEQAAEQQVAAARRAYRDNPVVVGGAVVVVGAVVGAIVWGLVRLLTR